MKRRQQSCDRESCEKMPGIWVLALPLADLAMSFHLSGPQVTSWKYERFI